MNYNDFINSKAITTSAKGIEIPTAELNPMLFDFQRDIVRWALAKGKAAIFADCGKNSTLTAKGPSAVCHYIARLLRWIVRRLTPRECEHSQGG